MKLLFGLMTFSVYDWFSDGTQIKPGKVAILGDSFDMRQLR